MQKKESKRKEYEISKSIGEMVSFCENIEE